MNALVPVSSSNLTFDDIRKLGADIAKSNLFGIKTQEAAVSLMMLAQAEGLHPATAARDYDIINGRPAKKSEAMHRQFFEAGGKIEWHTLTDTEAKATFSHPVGGKVTLTWDMERAQKAGFGTKENYKRFPRQMLRSRLISEGVRTVWPGSTGCLYAPEEVADFGGTTLDHEPEPEAPQDAREAINDAVPMPAAAAATPRPPRKVEKAPTTERTDEQWEAWLDKLRAAMAVLRTEDEVSEVGNRSTVGDALKNGPPWVKREIDAILAAHHKRVIAEQTAQSQLNDDPFAPGLEIVGEEKLGAG